jgi:cytochrome d ubiquinol oxidase subunit I
MVWAGAWYFFSRVIAKGVDGIAPSDTLFHHHEEEDSQAGGGHVQTTFAKPTLKPER